MKHAKIFFYLILAGFALFAEEEPLRGFLICGRMKTDCAGVGAASHVCRTREDVWERCV